MSLRTFTVFQDAVSGDEPKTKVSRPNVMVTRSSSLNGASSTLTTVENQAALNKENYHPVTGERAGKSIVGVKKRKENVLAAKVLPPNTPAEPEPKKRKASSMTKSKSKKEIKGSGLKKCASKRAGSRKVSPMPKLNEEEETTKDDTAQANADSRCYELTVKPLADVSEAYDAPAFFKELSTVVDEPSEGGVKFRTVKCASVEPEIRDYFQPTQDILRTTTTRMRALSEDIPERTFSTPERKQIYAAFTFSSPSAAGARFKASRSGSISPTEPEFPRL
ncbi:hypothetical protein CPB84DRAFT_1814718 [Gymnopilus junonius]|uniref:Uncharacterized protein n=1 Tax=Gymnopilus junonius TaxID=109634 RepID=A0A9P5NS35_GYMJU|nr:hypothetical protein CPB84DRAFT_1814718 [Gymnopilus junonius]